MTETAEIMIGGRRFRLQCGPGEAARLQQLAKLVDQCASTLIQGQRGMGEEKVLLLSSLMLADHLEEARSEADRLRAAQSRARSVTQDRVTLVLATAARRLDAVAAEVERVA